MVWGQWVYLLGVFELLLCQICDVRTRSDEQSQEGRFSASNQYSLWKSYCTQAVYFPKHQKKMPTTRNRRSAFLLLSETPTFKFPGDF